MLKKVGKFLPQRHRVVINSPQSLCKKPYFTATQNLLKCQSLAMISANQSKPIFTLAEIHSAIKVIIK